MKLKVNETQMNYFCAKNHANLKIQTHIQWVWILKGQVHGSAHAHLSKCRFSARTCCIIFASNMIMSSICTLPWQSLALDQLAPAPAPIP